MTINPTASAKLEQVSHAALDAIYAERTFGGPELGPLIAQYNRQEISQAEFLTTVKNHFGDTHEGQMGMITFAMEQLQVTDKRKRAVERYVETRQLIESLAGS